MSESTSDFEQKVVLGGYCDGCPFSNLRLSSTPIEDGKKSLWFVRCENEKICKRISKLIGDYIYG